MFCRKFCHVFIDHSSVFLSLLKLKSSSAGPDLIPPFFLKNLRLSLTRPLTDLFNLCAQTATIPSIWREAVVVPVFKKGSASKLENYRPISLTSSCCKLFESQLKNALLSYAALNKLLSPAQHGFLSRKSTCTNLLETFNDWTVNLDSKLSTFVLFIDFAKAFDCVSIPKLIYKLKLCGIGGTFLNCIESLLSERFQRVRVGTHLSERRPILSGVPRGSVLGPILFLFFINDFASFLPPPVRSKLFADDVKSYLSFSDDSRTDIIPSLLTSLETWSSNWQLPISISKCIWLLISFKNSVKDLSININGCSVNEIHDVKDLGVLFNSRLSFSQHISSVIAKAKQRLFL